MAQSTDYYTCYLRQPGPLYYKSHTERNLPYAVWGKACMYVTVMSGLLPPPPPPLQAEKLKEKKKLQSEAEELRSKLREKENAIRSLDQELAKMKI